MIVMFVAVVIGIFSINFFSLNFKIQGLNRAVIFTPIELFYQDVSTINKETKFTVEDIIKTLDEYYEKSLKKYVNEYYVDYYFYNKSDGSMCLDDYCDALEITVESKLSLTYTYHRVMFYELVGR